MKRSIAVMMISVGLCLASAAFGGANPNFRLPLDARTSPGWCTALRTICCSESPVVNVAPGDTVYVFVLLNSFANVAGVQTAIQWDGANGWDLIAFSGCSIPGQVFGAQPNLNSPGGGPTAGVIATAFPCLTSPGCSVPIAQLTFIAGSAGCVTQVEPAFPNGIHVVDCAQGIDRISLPSQRVGSVCVSQGGGNACLSIAPQCDAGGPYTARAGQAVLFDGTGSVDPDGTITSYAWDFGDGTTGSGPTPSHTYGDSGTRTVTLTVTDNLGATSSCEAAAMILFEGRFTPVFADSTGSVGSYASVARDADGFIYVSYYDETHGDLRLASNRSGWTTETVDSGGDVGGWTSLQFDWTPIPVLHIAYYDFNNRDLKYATRSPGGSWAIEVVDSSGDVGRGSSIAVNDLTRPVIVYWDATNEHLKYATRTPTGWQREVVDTNVGSGLGWSPSLAIDSTGKPHISYYKDAGRDLYYATKSGTTWVKGPVDQVGDVGRYSTIAAKDDPQPGIPEIAYYDATNGDLKLARQLPGGAWERMVIDATGDVGMYPSLALNHCVGPDCFDPPCPTIVYSDATFGDLRRATRPDGLCSVGHCPFIQDVVVHVGHIEPRGSFNLGVCPGQRRDVIATPIHTGGETQLMVLESRGASSVSDAPAPPGRMLLSFANPFAPPETIRFAIDKSGSVQVKIVDVAGRVVRSLADGTRQAGEHAIAWDGHDEHGALVAQGVYFFNVLVDGRQQAQQKLIVVR